MGSTISPGGIWLPIEPPDRSGQRQLPLSGEKDRRLKFYLQRCRECQQENPDAGYFRRGSEEREAN